MLSSTLSRALAVSWMTLIFLLSSQPTLPVPVLFSGLDKLLHALCYGVLGFFLARSFSPPEVAAWRRVVLLTVLVTAYGITDEYHQSYVPGRNASIWDVLADGVGGFAAALIMHWHYRRVARQA